MRGSDLRVCVYLGQLSGEVVGEEFLFLFVVHGQSLFLLLEGVDLLE